jgi:predicted AAA+ superfamily ATPase
MMNWYEELGFDTNPFTIKPQESFYDFYGEKDTIKDVLKAVTKGSMVQVIGEYGTGKTTVLKAIIDKFKGKRKVFYYNAYTSEKSIDYDRILVKGGSFFSRLFGIKTKEMILLLDEAHNMMPRDLEDLQDNFNEGFFKSVILVTSDKAHKFPKAIENLIDGNRFELKMFGFEDAKKIVANRLEDDSDILDVKYIERIYKASKTPREFLMRCEDACRRAFERGADKVEEQDIVE